MSPDVTKRPLAYLVVILPLLVLGGMALLFALLRAFAEVRGVARSAIPNVNGILICLPALLFWMPISLLLSNCVLFAVPRLRRVAERFAAEAQRPDFRQSQRQLLIATGAIGLVCVPLVLLGFWL
jgi:hypothetical protein